MTASKKDVDMVMDEEAMITQMLSRTAVPERTVTLDRFGIPVTLKGLMAKQIYSMREQCTHKRMVRGNQIESFDEEQFNCLIISSGTVKPNWAHAKLKAEYGASSGEEVVKRMLLAGELSSLSDAILDLSGFNIDLAEVKN